MATLGNTYIGIADYLRSLGPDGNSIAADIVEILAEFTPVIQDAVVLTANNGSSMVHSVRDKLPEVTWGRLYKGVKPSKSGRSQVTDTSGFVEGLSSIDSRLVQIAGSKGDALRLSEARGFLQAMAIEAEKAIWYADAITRPEQFKGFAARANFIGAGTQGTNIIDAGGVGSDNTSIWFVNWSEDYNFLFHPENTPAGIERMDMGKQRATDADGGVYYVLEEMFRWYLGVGSKDPRGLVRIANIDVSEAQAGNVDLYALMRRAYYTLGSRRFGKYKDAQGNVIAGAAAKGRTAIYMNKDMLEVLDTLSTNGGSTDNFVRLTRAELDGEEVPSYRNMVVRETDAIVNTEAVVA